MDLCYNIEQVTLLEESGKVKVGWKWINKELDGNIQLGGKVHKILYFKILRGKKRIEKIFNNFEAISNNIHRFLWNFLFRISTVRVVW